MGEVKLPINKEDIHFDQIDGKTYIRFPLDKEEQIYGLGLNFKTVEQRNRIMELHVNHYGGKDNGRTHAPVPFFVSSKGYGILINSARYIWQHLLDKYRHLLDMSSIQLDGTYTPVKRGGQAVAYQRQKQATC